MATTVNNAFEEFMRDSVNLVPEKTAIARRSRDNLINNINGFSEEVDFFSIFSTKNLKYGSFARRTKIRELDDIDLMICLSAEGVRTYAESADCVYMFGSEADRKNGLITSGTDYLNSTKIINRFIKKLSALSDYSKAELHKNQEAATLQLKSYSWNFDIVPCFYTDREFYLIPDGAGNWKKTDPRIDSNRIAEINQKHNGRLLELIRLVKYWNNRKVTLKIGSYLLECMILEIYENMSAVNNWWIDLEFKDVLYRLSEAIKYDVKDPKEMQGNINNFGIYDRIKISNALYKAHEKATEAVGYESEGNQKKAIETWGDILGLEFPEYTGN
ncbi:MAG: nucleotidyltransferase [Lachnospiraceae bacterium]